MKKVSIGFLGNIFFDTRTFNLFQSLKGKGREVSFTGFDWLTEDFKSVEQDDIKVQKLTKNRYSILFYIKFFFSQLKSLILKNADIYFAADFFSLPAVVLAGKIRRSKIFYDSREIYTQLPFHDDKPGIKKVYTILEGFLIKRVDCIFTTGEMDSEYLKKLYSLKETFLLRNLPLTKTNLLPVDYHMKYNIQKDAIIILYLGIVVKGRGLEIYFKTIQKMNNLYLIILGGGEHFQFYKSLANEMKITERIIFVGKVEQDKILNYTAGAFAGLSIIDNISTNNYYALPNKLFEYIMSGIPVIVNDLPQMKRIVEEYGVGDVTQEMNEDELIKILTRWKENEELYSSLKSNCLRASKVLNWENEFDKVYYIFE